MQNFLVWFFSMKLNIGVIEMFNCNSKVIAQLLLLCFLLLFLLHCSLFHLHPVLLLLLLEQLLNNHYYYTSLLPQACRSNAPSMIEHLYLVIIQPWWSWAFQKMFGQFVHNVCWFLHHSTLQWLSVCTLACWSQSAGTVTGILNSPATDLSSCVERSKNKKGLFKDIYNVRGVSGKLWKVTSRFFLDSIFTVSF